MKYLGLLTLLFFSANAHAELSCAQLGVIAEVTVSYRDQGYSLQQVLDEIAKLKKTDKLTPEEVLLLQNVARKSFTRDLSPYEIVKDCQRAQ